MKSLRQHPYIILAILFTTAVFLRFWHLGTNPVGLHRDEAFLGYNAYSILKTGKDMSGHLFPLHLESFLWSPAGYSYATIPFIAVFGLNEFSVRFASALFGSLTVLMTFFLVRHMLEYGERKQNTSSHESYANQVALLSAFFLTVSPWHVNMSRTAMENTVVVFFLTAGTYCFFRYLIVKRLAWMAVSFGSYILTLFIYQSPRAFLPIFIPLLYLIYRKGIGQAHRLVAAILYVAGIILPLLIILSSPGLATRIRTVSVFATPQTQLTVNERIREDGVSGIPPLVSRVFHNKFLGYLRQFADNYAAHFSYSFLFGDVSFPARLHITGTGILYLATLPLLLMGIFTLVNGKKRYRLLILMWILVAPIGSALTFDDIPNLQRTLIAQPAVALIAAVGAASLLQQWKKPGYRAAALVIAGLLIWNITGYLHYYYVHQPRHRTWERNDGYQSLVSDVNRLAGTFDRVIITNAQSAPSVFFLFFNRYDPALFQKETAGINMERSDSVGFADYMFSDDECPLNTVIGLTKSGPDLPYRATAVERNTLYIDNGSCRVSTVSATLEETVIRSDGSDAFQILRVK